jgi:ankyrin repeat protein
MSRDLTLIEELLVNSDPTRVEEELNKNPQWASVRNQFGVLPFIWAFSHSKLRNKTQKICALLTAFPEAASIKNKSNRLPIHMALENEYSIKIIVALLRAYPDGAMQIDNDDMLPINYAIQSNNVEAVQACIKYCPDCVKFRCEELGMHALSWTLEQENELEIVFAVLNSYPEAASQENKNGKIPLHYAVEWEYPLEVITALIQAFPEGVGKKDKFEKLPRDYAGNAPIDIINLL